MLCNFMELLSQRSHLTGAQAVLSNKAIALPREGEVDNGLTFVQMLIETQLPQIIDYLLNHQLSPTAICQQLGACSSN